MSRFRIEVETAGVGGVAVIVDEVELTPAEREVLDRVIDETIGSLSHHDRMAVLSYLVEHQADDLAYRRVCERNGWLA